MICFPPPRQLESEHGLRENANASAETVHKRIPHLETQLEACKAQVCS